MAEEKIILYKTSNKYVVAKQVNIKAEDYPTILLSDNRDCSMTFNPDSLYINGELLGKITGMEPK